MKRLTDILFGRTKKQRRKLRNPRRRLMMEHLDRRVVLATDFAAIAGVVFEDTDNSGGYDAAADTELEDVIVRLTGPGTTTTDFTTGADGAYRFDNLSAGTYTVEQLTIPAPAPPNAANLVPVALSSPQTIVISAAEADTLQDPVTEGVVIDTFNATPGLTLTADTSSALNPDPNQRSDVDTAVGFGTTRDLFLDITSAAGAAELTTNDTSNFAEGTLNFNPNLAVNADFSVTWDGDSDPAPAALGDTLSVDLTAGGTATALQLQIGSDRPDPTDTITIEVFSGNANSNSYTRPLVDFVSGDLAELLIRFDDTPTATTGTGADFADASAIRMTVSTNSGAIDTDIALVRSIGPTVRTANIENEQLVPSIDLEKLTNGVNADTATGPLLGVGTTAIFTYVVENTGDTALGTIEITDNAGTTGTTDDFTVTVDLANANTTETSGDGDNLFEPGEIWQFVTTTNSRTVTTGQYTNSATVDANPVDDLGADIPDIDNVGDTDPSNHFGVTPSIDLEKLTNGVDADTATGPLLGVGTTATFTYVLENTGDTALGTIEITDNAGTTGTTADDFTVTADIANANTTETSGDGDNLFEPGEIWQFVTTTNNRTVTAGQYTNSATVDANPVDDSGTDIAGINNVGHTDPSNHFGVTPSIDLEKLTNGVDADTATGPLLGVGTTATFTYVLENTGDTALGTIEITDNAGTTGTTADDFTVTVDVTNANTTETSGDGDNLFEPGEIWQFVTTTNNRTVTAGQYTNSATVDANPVDDSGTDIAGINNVGHTDPSNHFGVTPSIDLEKLTNGVDADTATGPLLGVGTTATFTYVLENTGDTALGTIEITDNAGTTGTTADDFTVTVDVTNANTTETSGDGDNLFEPGEIWQFVTTTNSRTVTAGQYTNSATVDANPVDASGANIAGINNVGDTDLSNHLGVTPSIDLEKLTNGVNADTATGPLLGVGTTATFTYVLENTGDTALGTIQITDNAGTTGTTADDFTVTVDVTNANTTETSGDGDNLFEPGEIWQFVTTTNSRTVTAGQYTNSATVDANPVDASGANIAGINNVGDTDLSNHLGVTPSIDLEKLTNGVNADTATGPLLGVGTTATFTYVLENTGDTALGTIQITDNAGTTGTTADDFTVTVDVTNANTTETSGDGDNLFDPGEIWQFVTNTNSRTVTVGQYTNSATVDANPVDASGANIAGINNVGDTDLSNHLGVTPDIQIEKATNGEDADITDDQPLLSSGTTATFTYVVSNTGNTPLGSVVVSDDRGLVPVRQSGDTNNNNILETNETWTYQATTLVAIGQYTNIGTVNGNPVDETGADIIGAPNVSDTDPSNHLGVDLSKRRFLASFVINNR